MNLNIWEVPEEDREAFVVFGRFSNGGIMSLEGLEAMADDMALDFDLLKALVDSDGNSRIDFQGSFGSI